MGGGDWGKSCHKCGVDGRKREEFTLTKIGREFGSWGVCIFGYEPLPDKQLKNKIDVYSLN